MIPALLLVLTVPVILLAVARLGLWIRPYAWILRVRRRSGPIEAYVQVCRMDRFTSGRRTFTHMIPVRTYPIGRYRSQHHAQADARRVARHLRMAFIHVTANTRAA